MILNVRPALHRSTGKFHDVAFFDYEPLPGFRVLDLKLTLSPDGKKFIYGPRLGGQRLTQISGEFAIDLAAQVMDKLRGDAYDHHH